MKSTTDWQAIGYSSQAAGESFEDEIRFQASRVSHIRLVKQHPETKFFGRGVAKVVGTAYPDFILLSNTGFSTIFDAKSVEKAKRVKIAAKRVGQFEYLRDVSAIIPSGYLVHWRKWRLIGWHSVHVHDVWPPRVTMESAYKLLPYDLDGLWFWNLLDLWQECYERMQDV